jgi:hypothetical protein
LIVLTINCNLFAITADSRRLKEGILRNNNLTSATCKAVYNIPAAATPTPATTTKIQAILSPGAAAEFAIAMDGFMVAVDIEPDIVPELIFEVFMVGAAIIVDDISDIIVSDDIMVSVIMVSVIMVSGIMVSGIMVSGIMVPGIVITGVIMSMAVGCSDDGST